MRIKPKITIRTFLKKRADTWHRVTLGETDPVTGEIALFGKAISEKAVVLKSYLPKYSIKQLGIELYYLVLFHEFHHAIVGKHSTELEADVFAEQSFLACFYRNTVIPRKLWRNLPRQ